MRTAGFSTDTKRAEADLKRLRKEAHELGQTIGTSFRYAGIAIAGSAVAAAVAFDQLVKGAADFKDLEETTGGSAEGLASLAVAAGTAGISMEEVAGASIKLTKSLTGVDDESKAAGAALKALGIPLEEFKRLNPEQRIDALTKAFAGFRDGTEKTEVAVALFGKTGAEQLKLFKAIEEQGGRTTILTQKQIDLADGYADAQAKSTATLKLYAQAIAVQILPAVTALQGVLIDLVKETLLAGKSANELAKNNSIADWAESGALYVASFVDSLRNTSAEIESFVATTKKEFAGLKFVAAAVNPFNISQELTTGTGPLAEARKEYAELSKASDEAAKRVGQNTNKIRDSLKSQFSAAKTARDFAASYSNEGRNLSGLKTLDFDGANKAPKKTEKAKDDFTPLLKSIREKIALDKAEFDSVAKLTEGQKLQAKVFEDIDSGYVKLTLNQKLVIDGALQELLAIEKLNEAKQNEIKWIKESGDENDRFITGQQQLLGALLGVRDELEEQARTYGFTADEIRKLENARKLDTAAVLENKAALADNSYLTEVAQLYRDQAAAIRGTVAARDQLAAKEDFSATDKLAGADKALTQYLDHVRRAGDATYFAVSSTLQGLEDLTVQALAGGDTRDAAKSFVDGIIKEIYRLAVVKPLLESIFGAGGSSNGWAGLLGTIGSAFAGSYNSNYSNEGRNYQPRAAGGPVNKNTPYMVGERGPEMFVPNTSGKIMPNGSGAAPVVNVSVRGVSEKPQVRATRGSDGALNIDLLFEQFRDRMSSDVQNGGPFARSMQSQMGVSRTPGLVR